MLHLAKRTTILIAKGFCMGSADIVPGVSGGTMAFILGIYEELIDAIRTFGTRSFWHPLIRGNIRHAFSHVKWKFLLPLGAGIVLAILLLSYPLEYLLAEQPMVVWSFFFGLVVASMHIVILRVRRWSTSRVALFLLGTASAFLLVGLVPVETPDTWWFLFFSGAIAICAMILPGISGSFILLLLGKYETVLAAVNDRNPGPLLWVAAGCVVGIVAFSQVLSWLLHRYHDLTIAFLAGLMLGSLRKVWPWKMGEANILPDSQRALMTGLGLMIIGFGLVFLIEKLAHVKHLPPQQ